MKQNDTFFNSLLILGVLFKKTLNFNKKFWNVEKKLRWKKIGKFLEKVEIISTIYWIFGGSSSWTHRGCDRSSSKNNFLWYCQLTSSPFLSSFWSIETGHRRTRILSGTWGFSTISHTESFEVVLQMAMWNLERFTIQKATHGISIMVF